MQAGYVISGAAHGVLLLAALFGVPWINPQTEIEDQVTQVSLISAEEFDGPPETAPDIDFQDVARMQLPGMGEAADIDASSGETAPEQTEQDFVEDPSARDQMPDLSALLQALEQPEVAVDVGAIEEAPQDVASIVPPAPSLLSRPQSPARPAAALPNVAGRDAPPSAQPLPPTPREDPPEIDTSSDTPDEQPAKEAEPVEEIAPRPRPEPEPAPEPEPEPEPEPAPEPEPEPAPDETPDEPAPETDETELATALASPRPVTRPRDFDKVLDAQAQVAAVLRQAEEIRRKQEEDRQRKEAEAKEIADALAAAASDRDVPLGPPISSSASGSFFAAIEQCWDFDPGVVGAGDIVFTLSFALNPDGSVGGAPEVVSPSDWRRPGLRQAVESASRAVRRCGGRAAAEHLPRESYGRWQRAQVTFDPRKKALSW